MKTKHSIRVATLIALLNLLAPGQATAQTFTSLGDTRGPSDSPAVLGNSVYASLNQLVLSGDVFYGAYAGSDEGRHSGLLYVRSPDAADYASLHNFSEIITVGYGPRRNADGARPLAGLTLSGNTLYGTASLGGAGGQGTLYSLSTNGTGFTVLQNMAGYPQAQLVLSGNTLYGTTVYGGSSNSGAVFAINTNGTGFTNLHSFTATSAPGQFNSTNSNSGGTGPTAGLLLAGDTLYGTAEYGGAGGAGTVFALNRDGSGFRVVHSFPGLSEGYYGTNNEGAYPTGGLILWGDTLYGTAPRGGQSGNGTVFSMSTNGTGFRHLYSFTRTYPHAVNPFNDMVYTNLDGAVPRGPLTVSGDTLYGTTSEGGGSGQGTVFSISFLPQLSIVSGGGIDRLWWPTNAAGFTLEYSTNLNSPVLWSSGLPAPSIVNGRYEVTHSKADKERFYRLSQ